MALCNYCQIFQLGCVSDFTKTTRVSPHIYKELLELVRPMITYQNTNFRDAITAEERLSLTIRYLTRGENIIPVAIYMYSNPYKCDSFILVPTLSIQISTK